MNPTENDGKLTTGDCIAYWRHILRISQAELAQRAGLSQTQLSRIERGRESIGPEELAGLASALELPIEHLTLGGAAAGDLPLHPVISSRLWKLVLRLAALPAVEQEQELDLLEALVSAAERRARADDKVTG